jgi:hypothetical protein
MKRIITLFVAILSVALFLTGCPNNNGDDGDNGRPDGLAGKLLVFQAYGNGPMDGGSPGGVSHSFVELYNTTDAAIDLDGIGLYYADGTSTDTSDNTATEDGAWKRISLDGKTIPAGGSFLILGKKHTDTKSTRYTIPDNYGDINDNSFILSRRAFKAALIRSAEPLTVQNPFNADGSGKKVPGYIDMVGSANEYSANGNGRDRINGFELEPARNSASEAVRRIDLKDLDDNKEEFESIRYAANGMSNEMLEVRKPRNSGVGKWEPFAEPAKPVPTEGLMIFQAYGTGFGEELGASNDNTNTGSVSHSFIELYNNSATPIPLNTFSVQWANGKANGGGTVIAEDEDWNVINLTGTIPAHGSYLIRGRKLNDENGGAKNNSQIGRLQITVGDQDDNNFYMSNRSFKVALVSNQTKLAEAQPWDNESSPPGPKADTALLDLLGARNGNNDSTVGFKGEINTSFSKQNALRRGSLSDAGNNRTDFTSIDYRTADLTKFRPRSATNGSWTPEF